MDHLNSAIDAECSAKGHAIEFQLELAAAAENPAKFNDAELNAKHYLDNAGIYVPVPLELKIEKAKCGAIHAALHKEITKPIAEQTEKGKNAFWVVRRAFSAIDRIIKTWKPLAKRFKDYYDGAWASSYNVAEIEGATGNFYIYRFYVFAELKGGKRFKPVGLLNPHAYNARKMEIAYHDIFSSPPEPFGGFRDFVDAIQPPPVLPEGLPRKEMTVV